MAFFQIMCELREVNEAYQFFQKRETANTYNFSYVKCKINNYSKFIIVITKFSTALHLFPRMSIICCSGFVRNGLEREREKKRRGAKIKIARRRRGNDPKKST